MMQRAVLLAMNSSSCEHRFITRSVNAKNARAIQFFLWSYRKQGDKDFNSNDFIAHASDGAMLILIE